MLFSSIIFNVKQHKAGFTLIELSIVLVVIGLIVGGVLVGRDLIYAAETRAQISQIERYQSAVNTFRGKYDYIPGDIAAAAAAQFGFLARGSFPGEGDGNGILDGNVAGVGGSCMAIYQCPAFGENVVFWRDMSAARLVDGSFTAASFTNTSFSGTAIDLYLPKAKVSSGYIFAWSGGWGLNSASGHDGKNYFGIAKVTGANSGGGYAHLHCCAVAQAYAIDKKMDDGLPQYGNVLALTSTGGFPGGWASGGAIMDSSGLPHVDNNGDGDVDGGPVTATSGVTTAATDDTCFDNGNVTNEIEKYSITHNGGRGVNCVLSIKFQ